MTGTVGSGSEVPVRLAALPAEPLVTVLTAVYNGADHVADTVESVRHQSYPRIEHLLIDDGSTDDTVAVLDGLGDSPVELRVVSIENRGQTGAFNVGFDHARGAILFFLDADDQFLPDKVERCVDALRDHPNAGLVQHKLLEVDNDGTELDVYPPLSPVANGWLGSDALRSGGIIAGMSATSALGIRREIVDLVAPLDESVRIGDMALVGLVPLITEIAGIQEPLSTYRWHGGNITFSEKLTVESVRWRLDMMHALLDSQRTFLARQYPDLLDRLAPPEASRYLSELEYIRARLEGVTRRRRPTTTDFAPPRRIVTSRSCADGSGIWHRSSPTAPFSVCSTGWPGPAAGGGAISAVTRWRR